MTEHVMRVQAWGAAAVLTCDLCTLPGAPDTAVLRAKTPEGLSYGEIAQAVGAHLQRVAEDTVQVESEQLIVDPFCPEHGTMSTAYTSCSCKPVQDAQRVPGQVEFGGSPTHEAFSERPGGGDPLGDYLYGKGEGHGR